MDAKRAFINGSARGNAIASVTRIASASKGRIDVSARCLRAAVVETKRALVDIGAYYTITCPCGVADTEK